MDLESDCAALITALAGNCEDYSEVGRVVEDCKEYLASFSSINFRHIYRETNGVAHRLAHLASLSMLGDF